MPLHTNRVPGLLVLGCLLLTTACTEERALAVKTGADAFSAQATAAIDAVAELHLRAALGKPADEEARIKTTTKDLLDTQAHKPGALDAVVRSSFTWLSEREKARRTLFGEYDVLKALYTEFAGAYRRLPEGSLLAAEDVVCSAQLGARLVSYMATAGKTLAANPVPLGYEIASSELRLTALTKSAAKVGKDGELGDGVRTHVALLKENADLNAQAVAKLAAAAESGATLIDLLEGYANVSVADLLKGVRRVLEIKEGISGLSMQAHIQRLDDVIARLNSKEALRTAIRMPVNAKPASCR